MSRKKIKKLFWLKVVIDIIKRFIMSLMGHRRTVTMSQSEIFLTVALINIQRVGKFNCCRVFN